jgi:microcystin-dependent protein
MATVTGFTSERMLEIENTTIVDGHIDGDDLILVQRNLDEINAGNVRGPVGPQGPNADTGDVKASIRSTPPTGWLALNGQVISGANVTYPDLWAVVPAAWKSGTTLTLPNMTDAILQGGGTLGAITGDTSVTLDFTHLPPHTHTGPSHQHTGPNHTHAIDHDHASATTSTDGAHTHAGYFTSGAALTPGGIWYAHRATDGAHNATVAGTEGSHDHTLNLPPFTGSSGNGGTGLTGAAGTGATGPGPGTSQPVDIQQKAMRINWFIKT